MDQKLKERLLGAVIILSVLVFVLPILFKPHNPNLSQLNLDHSNEDELDNSLDSDEKPPRPMPIKMPPKPIVSEVRPLIIKDSKAVPKPALLTARVWVLRMGLFSHPTNAKALVEKLSSKGYHAYSSIDNDKGTRVFVGPYKNEHEIKKIRDRLQNELKIQGLVLLIDDPKIGAIT